MLNLISTSQFNNLTFKSSENSFYLNKMPKELSEIAINPQSLKTGYVSFSIGTAPDFVWDEEVGKPSRQPSDDYKRAFSIKVIDRTDGEMDWSGAGYGSCAALEEIFSQIDKSRKEKRDEFPIFKYLGSEPKKVGKGNTRIPRFELIGWAEPNDLPWTQVDNISDEAIPF